MRLKTKLQCKEELKPSKWKTEENTSNQIKVILDENSSFNKAVDATHYKAIFSTLQERIDIVKSQQITKNGKLQDHVDDDVERDAQLREWKVCWSCGSNNLKTKRICISCSVNLNAPPT